MKTKSLITFTVIALALLVGACAPASNADVRTLSVSGSGEAMLSPDIAYVYVGVHTEAPSAAEAVEQNTTQTEALIQAIRDFGIEANDIRTTNFSIYPMDRFDPATDRIVSGSAGASAGRANGSPSVPIASSVWAMVAS